MKWFYNLKIAKKLLFSFAVVVLATGSSRLHRLVRGNCRLGEIYHHVCGPAVGHS